MGREVGMLRYFGDMMVIIVKSRTLSFHTHVLDGSGFLGSGL